MRPRILDLFCGAGGAAMGYHRAGFEVVGVDIKRQRRYPFEFVQADALEYVSSIDVSAFSGVHASPLCQAYSSLRHLQPDGEYPELIPPTRELLIATGLPYVIENVVGAPLIDPIMLCGSSMGLRVRRHRLFELNFPAMVPGCAHGVERLEFPVGLGSPSNAYRKRMERTGPKRLSRVSFVYGSPRYPGDLRDRKRAMGIDWMTNAELTQAIPPAYTEHIGAFLLREVNARALVA